MGIVAGVFAAMAMGVCAPGARGQSAGRKPGLNAELDVSQYAHTSWKVSDGFTKGVIYAIAQTPDGYLWLGTSFGLYRFDGVRAVPWQPPAGQPLPSSDVRKLRVTRDGTLWIGTTKGLASWKDGKFTHHEELTGQAVFALLEDHEGTLWVGSYAEPTGRLCAIRNGSVQCWGHDGTFGLAVGGLYEDAKGNLWAGVRDGLWRWKPGPAQFYSLPGSVNTVRPIAEDADGSLVIGTQRGIQRFVDGKTTAYPLPAAVPPLGSVQSGLRDGNGSLWIGSFSTGLVHIHNGRTDVFSKADGLSDDAVLNFFVDRESNIWVATANGLDRFRDFAVATFTMKQGLSQEYLSAVLADRDGSVWVSNSTGLDRWNNGKFTAYGKQDRRLNGHSPHSLIQDSRGRIWICTLDAVGFLENGRFVPAAGMPGGPVFGLAEDGAGNLWFANHDRGLLRLSPGGEVQQIPWATLGHKDTGSAIAADPSQGGLWIGFANGGIVYFKDGQVHASYSTAQGLAEGQVTRFRFDPDGTVWVSTAGGLSRIKNGRVATLTSKNGLPCDPVHWVIQDNEHAFWLNTPCGVVRIARSEVDAWAAAVDKGNAADHLVRVTTFDNSDGARSISGAGAIVPAVTRARDGRLWYRPGTGGVGVIDPKHLTFNKLPPPVQIEQVTADRKSYDVVSLANEKLPALLRELEIDYTALSFVAPERVRFRYKLEGWDSDWQDVGNRRQAFYSNLPPRHYRFRVLACNNSGVWNETGAALDFSIAPAYYQTSWFLLLCAAGFLGLLWAVYQMRLRQVTEQVRNRMEGRLEERERIARDLHDTLLQSVQGLILKFHALSRKCDEAMRLEIEKTLDHADEVMAEGRDRVRNLRATTMSLADLPAAFRRVANETAPGREATFKVTVEGRARELNPMILEESFSIGREALSNALIHSGGQNVEVEITYDARQFRLRINDDGRGVDADVLEKGGRPGHWGLPGMRERARKIGGQLEFWSRLGTGTEIELKIPGGTAYSKGGTGSKGFWFGRALSRLRGRYE